MCVTSDAQTLRFFIKSNGNLGHIDGPARGLPQLLERQRHVAASQIAALNVKQEHRLDAEPQDLVHLGHVHTPAHSGLGTTTTAIASSTTCSSTPRIAKLA